ncbi:MAG: ankyrin repeat domain-containing protein [Gammaproteobacteria bacterium]
MNEDGIRLLVAAIQQGNLEHVQKWKGSIYEIDDEGRTPLHWAARFGIVCPAKEDLSRELGPECGSIFISWDDPRIAEELMKKDRASDCLEHQDNQGDRPLFIAVKERNNKIASFLLHEMRKK